MQWVSTGKIESAENPQVARDWSDLGRLIRQAAMDAVTLHFADLASSDPGVSHGASGGHTEAVIS